ncbi:DUF2493 domain-containing protein [Crossiella sp. CA-258035]|uniref:DUF2493 domain-containing protein n=1 Tax=Crossiella sp. CA-258035 TaxID=2981138 RepID=UPI0024BC8EC4|nr:DUF2493 domain-containing protein [Crossiella sp. CA-258035]WHT20978.1 DUF2493 domain-containing protein [Crossiella sp. CA-258035]
MKRILITGSRTWRDWDRIERAILDHSPGYPAGEDTLIVHGGCPDGADEIAATIAATLGLPTEVHRADWDICVETCKPGHRRLRYGKSYCPTAGPRRNAAMVEAGADVCLAFIRKGSSGASMTALMAELSGIKTIRYTEEGP